MHAGDIFAGKNLPLIDTNNGGSGVAYPGDAVEGLRDASRTSTRSSPATATMMTWADLKEYAEFNQDFLDVGAGRDEGRQERRRRGGRVPAAGEVRRLHGAARAREANVAAIYGELKK